jgi:hypothetical protein
MVTAYYYRKKKEMRHEGGLPIPLTEVTPVKSLEARSAENPAQRRRHAAGLELRRVLSWAERASLMTCHRHRPPLLWHMWI